MPPNVRTFLHLTRSSVQFSVLANESANVFVAGWVFLNSTDGMMSGEGAGFGTGGGGASVNSAYAPNDSGGYITVPVAWTK
jgi:hypothetical protein